MRLNPLVACLCAAFAAAPAVAEDSGLNFSGFGTLAATRANTDLAEFTRPNQISGATSSFDFGVDTLLGLQGSYKATHDLSFTVQGLVRKNNSTSFKGELAWAFAKYRINDSFTVRAGRIGLPVYMISDFRNVGYANTFLRPPVEVYGMVPVESVDGADVLYQLPIGDASLSVQFAAGQTKPDLRQGDSKFSHLTALHVVYENGPITLRFGRVDTDFSIHNPTLDGLYAALMKTGFTTQAAALSVADARGSFTSLGATFDYHNFIAQGEYAKRDTNTLSIPDTTGWYALAGYRFGKILPYYSHASITQQSPRTVSGIPMVGPLIPLAMGANALASNTGLQTSNSIGVRWDFHPSAALKVQFDRFSPQDEKGSFYNAKPGFTGPVNVLGVAVDFVF